MHCIRNLPGGYRECLRIDLQNDKKTALAVNAAGALITLALLLAGHFIVPVQCLFSMEEGMGIYFLRLAVMLLSLAAYVVLHELTHAAAMKCCGAGKLRFGFTGVFAFAGCEEAYFNKRAYRFIALAPLLLWGLLLTPVLFIVPRSWFWVVWFVQVTNISGAVGDIHVTLRCLALPKTVWILDTGLCMTAYDHVRINIKKVT